jgi:TPR repeat protein
MQKIPAVFALIFVGYVTYPSILQSATNITSSMPGQNIFESTLDTNNYATIVASIRKEAEAGGYEAPYAMQKLGVIYRNGYGVTKDLKEAFKWFLKSAELGNSSSAMTDVGKCYRYGEGTPKDPQQAVMWFQKATQNEMPDYEAMYQLGTCYQKGEGVLVNTNEAAKWLRLASDTAENLRAKELTRVNPELAKAVANRLRMNQISNMNLIADLYATGGIIPREYAEHSRTYAKSLGPEADKKIFDLFWRLYEKGDSIPPDFVEAAKWYRQAAELGNCSSMVQLGEYCQTGRGVPTNKTEAVNWYRKAAERGTVEAMFPLARCLKNGDGTQTNLVEAVIWFRRYFEAGADKYGSVALNLGMCYENGEGVERDREQASKWFEKYVELYEGFIGPSRKSVNSAYSFVGSMYHYGGVRKDTTEAIKWYLKGASRGDPGAMDSLGNLYERGEGTPQNYTIAYAWYCLSAAKGRDSAILSRDLLAKKMTLTQIAEAQKQATLFEQLLENNQNGTANSKTNSVARILISGTGFFVTTNGYILTAAHVVSKSTSVITLIGGKKIPSVVVRMDEKNDIALLKAEGSFSALPMIQSRVMTLGKDVFTLGFPNVDLQGFSPKLTKGVVSGLNGIQDDPSCFQISAAIQPGNSGGPLLNTDGCVVGMINSKLNDLATAKLTGSLPQNVNYAVKSSYILPLLDAIPEGNLLLKPEKVPTFEEIVIRAEAAICIVMGME